MFRKGPKILYTMTAAEAAEFRTAATIIQSLQQYAQGRLNLIVEREGIRNDDYPVFDQSKMHFFKGKSSSQQVPAEATKP